MCHPLKYCLLRAIFCKNQVSGVFFGWILHIELFTNGEIKKNYKTFPKWVVVANRRVHLRNQNFGIFVTPTLPT
jgi:hypothetical protein